MCEGPVKLILSLLDGPQLHLVIIVSFLLWWYNELMPHTTKSQDYNV